MEGNTRRTVHILEEDIFSHFGSFLDRSFAISSEEQQVRVTRSSGDPFQGGREVVASPSSSDILHDVL